MAVYSNLGLDTLMEKLYKINSTKATFPRLGKRIE